MGWSNFDDNLAVDLDENESILMPQMHLDTPLRNEVFRAVFKRYRVSNRYERDIKEAKFILKDLRARKQAFSRSTDPSLFNAKLMCALKKDYFPYIYPGEMSLDDRVTLTNQIVSDQSKICGIGRIVDLKSDPYIKQQEMTRRVLEDIVLKSAQSRVTGSKNIKMTSEFDSKSGRISIKMFKYMGVVLLDSTHYLVTRDQITLILDLVTQRLYTYIMCKLGEESTSIEYPRYSHVLQLIEWGDKLLSKVGNNGYKIIKDFEPAVMSILLRRSRDMFVDTDLYYDNIKEGLRKTCIENYLSYESYVVPLYNILENEDELNVHHLSQIFGLFRIWGHPWVNVEEGCRKLQYRAKQRRLVDNEAAFLIACQFKESFCTAYRSSHGVYPPIDTDGLSGYNMVDDCILHNKVCDIKSPRYHLEDWGKVNFKTFLKCDQTFNLATMINDKSISLNRDDLKFYASKNKGTGPSSIKRMILKWLESDMVNAKELLDDIDKNGFEDDVLTIGKCPKERELNPVPRLFSLMSLYLRMYFVVTEALLAQDILKYLPQITMIDDELTLAKKIFQCNRNLNPDTNSKFVDFVLNIDFEKWNSNMREASSKPLFKTFDSMYGWKNVFGRTHEIFQRSVMYAGDGTWWPKLWDQLDMDYWVNTLTGDDISPVIRVLKIPKFAESVLWWYNHLGGLEGLRQKGWTILTICAIAVAARRLRIDPSIMGQGDNQVVIISFKRSVDESFESFKGRITESFKTFKKEMYKFFDMLRLPIKESETWCSTCVFAYGKRLYFRSVQVSMSMKKSCRLFSYSNEGIPSLDTSISTIYANGVGACMVGYDHIVPFFMCTLSALACLNSHLNGGVLYGKKDLHSSLKWNSAGRRIKTTMSGVSALKDLLTNKQKTLFELLLYFPSILGGLPITYLSGMLIRGFPDPLSESCAILIKLYHLREELRPHILAWFDPVECDVGDRTGLIEDPLSLNLDRPTLPAMMIKRECQTALKEEIPINNPYMKTFINLSLSDDTNFKKQLCTLKPMWPKLIHDIYDSTLWGVVKSIIGRVVNTRTVQGMAIRSTKKNLSEIMKTSCVNYIRGTVDLCWRRSTIIPKHMCSRWIADYLRYVTWKYGRLVGVTVPHPMEYIARYNLGISGCDACNRDTDGYILIKNGNMITCQRCFIFLVKGPSPPYLGSVTREKISGHEDKTILNTEPLISRAIKLQRVVGWFVEQGSQLGELISNCLRSITDLDPTILHTRADQVTGSEEHRYHSSGISSGGFVVGSSNPYTHMHISTNTWTRYSKGTKNMVLDFQSTMCWAQVINAENIMNNDIVGSCVHYHTDCSECIVPVSETQINIHTKLKVEMPPSLPKNPLCWVPKERLCAGIASRAMELKIYKWTPQEDEGLLYYAISLSTAEQIIRCSNSVLYRVLGLDLRTLPFSWTLKLDPVKLLEYIGSILLISGVFSKITTSEGHNIRTSYYVEEARLEVLGLPATAYDPLLPILSSDDNRCCIYEAFPMIDPPDTTPLKVISGLKFFKNVMGEIIENMKIQDTIENIPEHVSIISSSTSMSSSCMASVKIAVISGVIDACKIIKREISDDHEVFILLNNPPVMAARIGDENKDLFKCLTDYTHVMTSSLDFMVKMLDDRHSTIRVDRHIKMPRASTTIHLDIDYPIQGYEYDSAVNYERVDLSSMIYRVGSQITTAYYKWLGILRSSDYEFERCGRIAVLGDGVGGVSALVNRLKPNINIYYNTLIDIDDVIPQSLGGFVPPALEGSKIDKSQLIGYPDNIEGITDITDERFPEFVGSRAEKLDMILCDAEGDGWEGDKGMKLLKNITRLARLTGCEHVIIKIFCSNLVALSEQLCFASVNSRRSSIVFSDFSSLLSTEAFVEMRGIFNVEYEVTCEAIPGNWDEIKSLVNHRKYREEGPSWAVVKEYTECLDHDLMKVRSEIMRELKRTIDRPLRRGKKNWFSTVAWEARRRCAPLFINLVWERRRNRLQLFDNRMQFFLLSRYLPLLVHDKFNAQSTRDLINLFNVIHFVFYETDDGHWAFFLCPEPVETRESYSKKMTLMSDRSISKKVIKFAGGIKLLGLSKGEGYVRYDFSGQPEREDYIYVAENLRPKNEHTREVMKMVSIGHGGYETYSNYDTMYERELAQNEDLMRIL